MIAEILSWVIPAIGLASFWLCIKHPWGWFVGIVQQMGYLAYAFVTHNWGFIFHSVAFTAVFVRNYVIDEAHLKRKREKKARKAAKRRARILEEGAIILT